MMSKQFKIIGHRGFGPTNNLGENENVEYPENTLKSFQYVLDQGADGIELDVFKSLDDVAVVIHDERLHDHVINQQKAQAKIKPVSKHTYNELRGFDLRGHEKIPRLQDVFALVSNYNDKIINLDVKDPDSVPLILKEIKKLGNSARQSVVISSYNWDILRSFRSQNASINLVPAIKSAILFGEDNIEKGTYKPLTDKYQDNFEKAVVELHNEIGVYAFDCSITDYTPKLIDLAVSQGVGLQLSTGMDRVNAEGTDYPLLKELLLASQKNLIFAICKVDEPQFVKKRIGLTP